MAWVRRAGILLVAALVLLEVSLQIAAWMVRPDRSGEAVTSGEAIRILCAGDSHTLGVGVLRKWAYPAQLELRLAELYWPREVRVTNVGVAGANTAYVANRLNGFLVEYDPHLLILWVGINNRWNTAETQDPGLGATLESRLMHSRVYRLIRVVLYTRSEPDFTRVRPRDWAKRKDWIESLGTNVPADTAGRTVAEDLESMIVASRAAGVPVLLIDYPWVPQESDWLSSAISRAGQKTDVSVVDTLEVFIRASETHGTKALVKLGAGPHPSELLYRHIVGEMLPTIAAILSETHAIEPSPEAAAPRAQASPGARRRSTRIPER